MHHPRRALSSIRQGREEEWAARCLRRFDAVSRSPSPGPLADHLVRQAWAKSNQVLSAAAPDCFIFCHSSAHACIRAREAGGRLRGCESSTVDGVFTGAAAGGSAERSSIVADPSAGPRGRAGGSGTTAGGFAVSAAAIAKVGQRKSAAAISGSSTGTREDVLCAFRQGVKALLALLMALGPRLVDLRIWLLLQFFACSERSFRNGRHARRDSRLFN